MIWKKLPMESVQWKRVKFRLSICPLVPTEHQLYSYWVNANPNTDIYTYTNTTITFTAMSLSCCFRIVWNNFFLPRHNSNITCTNLLITRYCYNEASWKPWRNATTAGRDRPETSLPLCFEFTSLFTLPDGCVPRTQGCAAEQKNIGHIVVTHRESGESGGDFDMDKIWFNWQSRLRVGQQMLTLWPKDWGLKCRVMLLRHQQQEPERAQSALSIL